MKVITAIILTSAAFGQSKLTECKNVVLQKRNLAICIPVNWFAQVQAESDRVFACSNLAGRCSAAVGGFPVRGTATVVFSVLAPDDPVRNRSVTDWIKGVLRYEVPLFSGDFPAPEGIASATGVTKVGRAVLLGVKLADATWLVQYFIAVAGQPTLLVTLEANTLDPNIDRYIVATEQMVRSITLGGR